MTPLAAVLCHLLVCEPDFSRCTSSDVRFPDAVPDLQKLVDSGKRVMIDCDLKKEKTGR